MASILPNGKSQFVDANGAPYAGGQVFFYVPSTLTYKDTYQDAAQTILNTNPVVLDAAGRAVIYGNGDYRQRLVDSLGNLIWDQETSSVVSQAMEPVVAAATIAAALALLGGTPAGGPVTAPTVNVLGAQTLTIAPTANASISTLASLNVQGNAISATTREFQTALGMTSSVGSGASGSNGDKVTLYSGMDAHDGSGDVWAFNTVTTMNAGSGTYNAQGYELDFNNLLAHRGDALAGAGLAAPVAYGLSITGASTFRSTSALLIAGTPNTQWNRGITMTDAVVQVGIQDLSNAVTCYEIFGTHTYGIDAATAVFSAGAVRVGAQQKFIWRNQAATADLVMLQSTSTDQFFIGDGATMVVIQAPLEIANNVGFFGHAPATKPTVTGSRSNAGAITSLLTSLASLGLITDSTTP